MMYVMDIGSLEPTPRLAQLLADAGEIAEDAGVGKVGAEHVFAAMLRDRDAIPTQQLERLGVDPAQVLSELEATMSGPGYRTPSNRVRTLDGEVFESRD